MARNGSRAFHNRRVGNLQASDNLVWGTVCWPEALVSMNYVFLLTHRSQDVIGPIS
jgi:hypothetical protein